MTSWATKFAGCDREMEMLYLKEEEAKALSIRLRLAWITSVVQRLFPLYSPDAVSHYGLDAAADHLWEFALTGSSDESKRERLMAALRSRGEEAEREGYGLDWVWCGLYP